MADSTLSDTPIHDRRYSRIKNFKSSEDFHTISHKLRSGSELWSDPSFSLYLEDGKTWLRPKDIVKTPMFMLDAGPHRFDVIQGELDNCWLIAGMEAMTRNQDLINYIAPADQDFYDNYSGAFHFRIWGLGMWNDVVVDDRLPVYSQGQGAKTLCYAHSLRGDVFWGALYEKAYAKFIAKTKGKYEDLDQGFVITSLQDLSGGIVQRISLKRPPEHKTIREILTEVYDSDDLMCVTTSVKVDDGLIPFHSYTVTKVTELDHKDYSDLLLVRVLNPWGFEEWTGKWSDQDQNEWRQIDRTIRDRMGRAAREDGEFWMEFSDFCERFTDLWVVHLEPTQFLQTNDIQKYNEGGYNKDNHPNWYTLEIRGQWIDFYNDVGSEPRNRHRNPQYMFNIYSYSDNKKDTCPVVIDLIFRSRIGRDLHTITYYVYDYDGTEWPLTGELEIMKPNNDEGFSYGSYNSIVYLKPGNFIVIPCTQGPEVIGLFLLRVFACNCPLKMTGKASTYDKKPKTLAKAMLLDEQSAVESNAIPMRMFIDTAQGSSEIDWIGLKNILEEAFNPSGSFFKIVLTFIKYIQDYLEINLVRPFEEKENSKFIFTKDECRKMIAMYDEDRSGKLNISEFCDLWGKICFWTKAYEHYRDEETGYLKIAQLREALNVVGYGITEQTVQNLSYVYSDEQGMILLTDFILCGVTLQTTLSLVEKADVKDNSNIIFTFDEWVKKTLIL